MPHRVIRVRDDPVGAVIAARQQIAAPLAEQIGHPPTLGSHRARAQPRADPTARKDSPGRVAQTAPKGPPVPGEVPETGVGLVFANASVQRQVAWTLCWAGSRSN